MERANLTKRNNLLKTCVNDLFNCLDYVKKYSNNTVTDTNVLQEIAKEYCELDITFNRAQKAYEATDNYFQNQEDCIEDSQKVFEKYLSEQPETSYQNHSIWHKFNSSGVTSEDVALEVTPDEVEDVNNSIDEEGIVPSQFEPPVDPITKKIIQNPCRNRKCGHVYEYDTIMEHLRRIKLNKVKPRCPYIGCTNTRMASSNILRDDQLRDQILTYNDTQSHTKQEENISLTEIL